MQRSIITAEYDNMKNRIKLICRSSSADFEPRRCSGGQDRPCTPAPFYPIRPRACAAYAARGMCGMCGVNNVRSPPQARRPRPSSDSPCCDRPGRGATAGAGRLDSGGARAGMPRVGPGSACGASGGGGGGSDASAGPILVCGQGGMRMRVWRCDHPACAGDAAMRQQMREHAGGDPLQDIKPAQEDEPPIE